MKGVNMMVNKRREQGQQMQSRPEHFMQDDSGHYQGDLFNDKEEEFQYVNNYQGQRNNNQGQNPQQWWSQGNWNNQGHQGNWSGGNNNQINWNNQGQISKALNTSPKEELPSDTVVNLKGGNNMGHAIEVTSRSGKGEMRPPQIRPNLEVQLGQISQTLNTSPKGELPSDTMVNPKGGNNMGHAMDMTARSGKANEEVRIDIDDSLEETQEEVNPSREYVIDMLESVVPKAKAPMPRPPPLYPQRLVKNNSENQFKKCIDMMKNLSINVPLVEALEQIPGYAKFMNDLVTKKRSMNCETIKMTHQVSAIVNLIAIKLEDPGAFTIPCTIGSADFAKDLYNVGASINLMPYLVFKTLGIGKLRPTSMRLKMADRTMKRPLVIIDDVFVRVDKFNLPAEFVILDCDVDYQVAIIWVDLSLLQGRLSLTWKTVSSLSGATMNVEDNLEAILINLDDDDEKEGYVECVNTLQGMRFYTYEPRKLSLDLENRKSPPTKPSIKEPPTLELKSLPPHLR
ncbi:uncharacterized protein [Nicotiana sylvestris]|uniref:uncharacterized protein n=1 Tax=Nicotiana sylvestris TaxID=4096 RepID=UPI00388CA2D4